MSTFVGAGRPDAAAVSLAREGRAACVALLAFTVFFGLFFLRSLVSTNLIAPSDSLDFGVSTYLSHPQLWTDGIWSGYPAAADPFTETWYPVLQVMRFLGVPWNYFLLSGYVITGVSACLFVRVLTGSMMAGLFGGLICSFGGFILGYINNYNQLHAFAWSPLLFYGLELTRRRCWGAGTAVTAGAVGMMWLAGHPQEPLYVLYVAGLWVLVTVIVDRDPFWARRLGWSLAGVVIGCLLAGIVLVPMLELGDQGFRAEPSWKRYASSALPSRELITLVLPLALGGFTTGDTRVPYVGESSDPAYLGLVPLVLILVGLLSRERRELLVWIGLAGLELALALGPATPLGPLFFYAPGFASFQAPVRHLFPFSLCVAAAAGVAVAGIERSPGSWRRLGGAVLLLLLGAVVWGALLTTYDPGVAELLGTPDYRVLAFGWPGVLALGLLLLGGVSWSPRVARRSGVLLSVLLGLLVADLTVFHYHFPGRQFEYADIVPAETVLHPRMAALKVELDRSGERILASDGSKNQFLLPNLTRAWGVRAASGSGSLGLRRYLELLQMDTSGAISLATIAPGHQALSLFGVRYVLARAESPLSEALGMDGERWQRLERLEYYPDDPDTHYELFRSTRVMPRAWCAPRTQPLSEGEALAVLHTGSLNAAPLDLTRVALVEEPGASLDGDDPDRAPPRVVASMEPYRYDVDTEARCMLVASEVFYPWWRATIDGTPADVWRVNHAMVGVRVPAGHHVVMLSLQPVSLWIGGGVTLGGLLTLGGVLVASRGRRSGVPPARARV